MPRRWWKWLIALGLIPLFVWGYDRFQMIYWVGSTDLEVEFAVTEAGSGKPIPGARIDVQSEGSFYEERDTQVFVLHADASGMARKECRQSMCFGTQSNLRFTDTFVVHLPWWLFQVSADGYLTNEWVNLNEWEYAQQVQRAAPGKAKLVVRVSLQKRPTERSAEEQK
jgi:hypothetical protein